MGGSVNPGPDAGELKSRWIELGRSFARAHPAKGKATDPQRRAQFLERLRAPKTKKARPKFRPRLSVEVFLLSFYVSAGDDDDRPGRGVYVDVEAKARTRLIEDDVVRRRCPVDG
jgi:hypothetical protein